VIDVAVGDDDVATPLACGTHPREVRGDPLAVDALQVEESPVRLGEGPLEGLDQAERVLALERAEEVEDEEKDERILRQAEVGTSERRWLGHQHGERERKHRLGRLFRDRPRDERACHPHLVNEVECGPQCAGQAARLPEPDAGRVASAQQFALRLLDELQEVFGVQADDVRRVDGVGLTVLERMVLAVGHAVEGDRRERHPGALERRHYPPSSLSLAELGTKEADDVDSGCGDGHRRKRTRGAYTIRTRLDQALRSSSSSNHATCSWTGVIVRR